MTKRSRGFSRLLLGGICGIVSVVSIGIWIFAASGFRAIAATEPQAVGKISANETIRAAWDSGLYRERVVGAGIYWLDNDTILVSANHGPKPQTPDEMRAAEDWLSLWRLGEKPTPYGADPHGAARAYYCAARGEITYHQNIVDQKTGAKSRTRWVGTPGHEREASPLVGRLLGQAGNTLSIEKTDCEIYADPAMAGRTYVTDSEHRFYLDFGNEPSLAAVHARPAEPIVLMRADRSGRVELPVSNALINEAYFRTFDGAFYLINGSLAISPINHLAIWRDSNCWPIWRVDPQTARTERLCIPFGPWSGAMQGGANTSIQLAPTKVGLFFATNPIKAQEERGLYRLDNATVSRILPTRIWSPTVSPNGCRIAFINIPNEDALRPFSAVSSSIVAIDVCASKSD